MSGVAAAQSTQLAAEHAPRGQVDVEVARVVRQAHLLDERAHVRVDEVAAPGRVGGVVGRGGGVALGERQRQRVADGDRQRRDDEVERDGEQHERRRRRARRLLQQQQQQQCNGALCRLRPRHPLHDGFVQCRINHVADVANATGLRPQGASGSREKFFSPSVVK